MNISRIRRLSLLSLTALASSCAAQVLEPRTAPPAVPPTALLGAGTLLQTDFETSGWGKNAPVAVGTIDVANSTQPSRGLRSDELRSDGLLSSGLLPIRNSESNLGKLTLAFCLSASANRPVQVLVESFNARRRRTGGLATLIYPAAPDFYQRYALDLSNLKPSGQGRFEPRAPFVSFTFAPDGAAWKGVARPEIRLDNVQFARPAFYVSAAGSDQKDGKSEQTAFATPQKALDVAGPGDIIAVMDGTYRAELKPVAVFQRAGAPAAWIVLKNYPGQHPTFSCNGWNHVFIGKGSKQQPYEGPTLAYLEVRGLHIRGEGDVAKQKYAEAMGKVDSRTNTNGISVDGRFMTNVPHHFRFADNLVEYCPGGGIGPQEADWVTMENNTSRFNCWTTIYGASGMGTIGASNFDGSDNVYKMLLRNNIVYRNETFVAWAAVGHISDGNGIIVDVNQKTSTRPEGSYKGRTLVQSNLCFDNGGSGIHAFNSNRVDIINNTAYLNSASKGLE